MIRYYTNRQLSESFGVNLAKWKRWSREFLAPDPLGGLQSGYARQYSPDDAFQLFLAGYLVSSAGFTIPDTRQVLQDLRPLMEASGFRFDPAGLDRSDSKNPTAEAAVDIRVWIQSGNASRMHYRIQTIERRTRLGRKGGSERLEERWSEELLPDRPYWSRSQLAGYGARLLPLGAMLWEFVDLLGLPPACFSFLQQPPKGGRIQDAAR
ncbi:MAG: MerR family transcriptional regulator [Desulfobacteraceae bacterium]|nr:MerR family transcriptional regulator [Desulfobacteraceae bacterium]